MYMNMTLRLSPSLLSPVCVLCPLHNLPVSKNIERPESPLQQVSASEARDQRELSHTKQTRSSCRLVEIVSQGRGFGSPVVLPRNYLLIVKSLPYGKFDTRIVEDWYCLSLDYPNPVN